MLQRVRVAACLVVFAFPAGSSKGTVFDVRLCVFVCLCVVYTCMHVQICVCMCLHIRAVDSYAEYTELA